MAEDSVEPRAAVKDAARRRAAVDALLHHVTGQLPLLTCRPELAHRHFSAMALARLARLVRAMEHMVDGGFPDVVKTLGRSALETYVLGIYSLYGGQEAYDHIRGDHVRASRLTDLPDEAPGFRDVADRFEDWEGPTNRINWEDLITNRLPELLREAEGVDAEVFTRMLYNSAYRSGSMLGTHAGVGTVGGYGVIENGVRQVREVAYTPDDGTADVLVAGSQLAMLASRVFLVFGISAGLPARLFDDIVLGTDLEIE